MNRNRIYSGLALSVCLALTASPGCAGDDAKVAVGDAGAGGEAGEAAADAGGAPASGGSRNGSAGADTIVGGSSDGGASGDGGSAVGGSDPIASAGAGAGAGAGDANNGGGGIEASAGAGVGGSGDAGAGNTDGTPVPSACIGCGSDFCVGPRVACQNDPGCVSCRDDDYQTLACAQNGNFISWVTCICANGCTAACSTLCAG
jgi:hypothetical protein